MADRQRRRLAVLARHLEPEFDNSFSGALISSTCAAISDPLMFNSLSATTLNTLNAKANSVECLPLNSLSAETLNSVNAAATTSLSSLTLNSLSAETLNSLSCRTIPVVDRCQGPVPRFDKLLVTDGRGHICHMVGQQKSSQMCSQEVDKMGLVNKVVHGSSTLNTVFVKTSHLNLGEMRPRSSFIIQRTDKRNIWHVWLINHQTSTYNTYYEVILTLQ